MFQAASTFIGNIFNGGAFASTGYDGAKSSKRRSDVDDNTGSEDYNLQAEPRKRLISNTNDLARNFAAVKWTINRHCDFVVDFSFRADTGDEEFNQVLTDFVERVSQKDYFDHSRRFCRRKAMRLYEVGRIIQGDIFAVKGELGFLQAIEGDRVRTPSDKTLNGEYEQGLRINRGRVDRYAINRRVNSRFKFERTVRADRVIPFGYYSRWDQYRGR